MTSRICGHHARLLGPIASLALALVLPHGVYAQTTRPVSAVDEMADVPARVAVRELLETASSRGIPVEPLLTKVREGVAKSSTPERIRDAVRLLSNRLETARSALSPSFSVAELSAGAGALQVGVPATTLKELRALSPGAPLTVPLGVLTEMIADGVPVRPAASRVAALMKRGATSALLIEMGARVRADVASGMAPGAALEQSSQRVLSLLSAPLGRAVVPASPPLRPDRK